ncbi:DUF1330 domain-containing protein [Bosea vestrisii]|uniref:DUF1330 domain-containing protein n=1 Tax=Bosea vestrisii TaxID=151416 RepID=UPI0024DF9CB6|nr:DUF1330 domain-containing protein [Bosea vestrisii]WID95190.1 DUF1330 domain-containing protein [Bosea vestrisii]
MAKGYLIAQVTITNADAYALYAKEAGALLKQYRAKVIVKPETAIVKEGNPKSRTVIFEFESFKSVQEFWGSSEYERAKALRYGAAEADFILIEGTD